MQYVINLVDGAYLESEVTTIGTRNNSETHNIITALSSNGSGKITIQGRKTGGRWFEVDYTLLNEVEPQNIKTTGQIDEYRFIVEGASGTGTVIVSDTETGETIEPYAFYGETNGMTPQEIGASIELFGSFENTGAWTTATDYTVNQLWSDSGNWYLVLENYTSGATAADDIAGGTVAQYEPSKATWQATSLTQMKSMTPLAEGQVIQLSAGGRSGPFEYLVGDYSAEVAADTLEGVYVALDSDPDGSEGVLKRVLNGYVTPEMFGGVGDFDKDTETGTDDYSAMQAAATFHSSKKLELLVNHAHLVSQEVLVSGHCNINIQPSGCIFGTGLGRGVIKAINDFSEVTTFTALGLALFPAVTGYENSTVTTVDASALAVGDVILLKDETLNAYSTTTSPLAELATIVGISGNVLYLDCRLRRQSGYSVGEVYKLDKSTVCNLSGEVYGNKATVRSSAVSLKGYVDPSVRLRCDGNSGGGLLIHSCLRGEYRVNAKNLDNNPAANRLGYAVIAYGACKAPDIKVLASDVRHAYTDGVYGSTDIESGNVLDAVVTGVCYSATAAAWDTHPDSDGTVFKDIEAWAGHNNSLQVNASLLYAVQLRSSNSTVRGLKTDLVRCLYIRELKHVDSVNRFYNIEHVGELLSTPSGTDRIYGIVYAPFGPPDNPITQTGTSRHMFRASDLKTIEYQEIVDGDEYHDCSFDWSGTTLGWPSTTSVGSLHEFHNCNIYYPTNLNISNDEFRLYGTTVHTSGATFNLLDGAKLTAVNSGVECGNGSSSNSAFAYTTISSGEVVFKYSSVFVNDSRPGGEVSPFRNNATGGTVTVKDITVNRVRESFATRGDADATLKVGYDAIYQRQSASLTANRTFTLSTVGAIEGDKFHVTRTSSGASTLNIGGLKSLSTNEWCIVVFDGAVWRLMAYGSI